MLIFGAIITANITGRNLKVDLEAPLQGVRGEPAHIVLKVENKGKLPIFMCRIVTVVENLLTDERDEEAHYLSVGTKKTANVDFAVKEDRCGCIRISIKEVGVTDPLGLLKVEPRRLKGEDEKRLIHFMPKLTEAQLPPDELATYDMESYKYSAYRSGGDPAETFDIREYQMGDKVKAIHWKLSSKVDELVIREFGLPIENKVMVIVDKGLDDGAKAGKSAEEIEQAAVFASSLSFTLLGRQINHTIGWYDYLEEEFVSYRVDDEESYWIAVREFISSPYRKDDKSSAARYVEAGASREFSSYIYVSDKGRDIERLMEYGTVTLYRPKDFQ
ncbi:MAG: DUF58 domain-containing protein [Bacillota bacterium]|nr:DUF58 domain-containing protein [Bacillota bacterium]